MKKVLLSVAVVASMAMVSCGSDPMCDCADQMLEVSKKMEAVPDEEKMEAMGEMMKEMEGIMKGDCGKVFEEAEKAMEGLSDEEKEAKEKAMMESCPAIKEMEEMKNH